MSLRDTEPKGSYPSGTCGFWRGRFCEFDHVYGHIRLKLSYRVDGLPVEPTRRPLKRHLHSGDVPIVIVVDLRRREADFRVRITHLPYQ